MNIKQIQVIVSMKNEELDVNMEEFKYQVLQQLSVIDGSKFKIVLDKIDVKHSKTPHFTLTLKSI